MTKQLVRATSAAALFLLFGTMVPAYAADKPGKPPKQQKPPKLKQRHRSPQARLPEPPERTKQQAVAWQKRRGWLEYGGWQGSNSWKNSRAQLWESEHRTWLQRGGYGGYYIPRNRFRLYFGSQHLFRMHGRPSMYMGYPRFSYGGFAFLLLDPWPESWPQNWYATDDVYIDYDDGYYLCNSRYPGISLAITVLK
jgi:hypothetical protein